MTGVYVNTVLFLSGRLSQAEVSLTIMSWRRWGMEKGSEQLDTKLLLVTPDVLPTQGQGLGHGVFLQALHFE